MARKIRSPWLRYGLAVGLFAAALGIALLLQYLGIRISLTILIMASLFIASWYGGRGPGLLLTVLLQAATIALNPIPPEASVPGTIFGYFSTFAIVVFIVWIISGRKEVEDELREQRELSDVTLSSIGDAVIACDIDGRIRFLNPTAESLTGWKRNEAVDQPVEEVFHVINEETGQRVEDPFSVIKKTDGAVALANHSALISRDGREIPIEDSGAPIKDHNGKIIGGVIIFHDVTKQKLAASELRRSEERYRQLFESNPFPMWVYDIETLAFLAVNDAASFYYGYSHDEFLSMTIRDIRPETDVPALLANIAQPHERLENADLWQHRKKDGTVIDVEVSSHELVFNGRPARLVLANDVTERKRVDNAIRQLNETLEQRVADRTTQLEDANKELEAFTYSVSHDLRAPLRAIDGFSRILVEDYAEKLDAEGERVLSVIRNNAQNMGKLIDDLLEFSRLGRKPLEAVTVDMSELARHVYEDLQPISAEPSHTGGLIVSPLPPAFGDRSLLRQVFMNLISNAIKYSRTREDGPIEVGCVAENGQNVYYVRDHGVGFDMKYVNKLFGVFQRLHSAEEFEGTGVGLAIVQRVVSRHGGRVWAEAELGKGATFYFSLPGENSEQKGDN